MEGPGPETKRPRHHYEASHRMPPQQQNAPIQTSHNTTSILPAPSSFPPGPQQPPPPSPFHDVNQESRSLPDPHSYVQQNPHSGHTTPRDGRFPPTELTFSRRESVSGTPRSPDDHPHFPPSRPMSIVTTGDGHHYSGQYPVDPPASLATYPQDAHMNGTIHHGLSMHGPDPSGHPMVQAYGPEYSQSPVTAGPHPYNMHYGPSMGQASIRPKKGNRAQQACDVCRTRKAKCDEGRPRCGFCLENDTECHYQSVAPAKVDRANQAILEQLDAQQKSMDAQQKSIKDFGTQLERIEQLLSSKSKQASTSAMEEDTKPILQHNEHPSQAPPLNQKAVGPSGFGSRDTKIVDASPSGSFNTTVTESSGNDAAVPSIARQNAIHIEHNTAAQKLFRWPSIKALLLKCKGLNFTEFSENYFMSLELSKGPLRLYGKGQGPELGGGSQLSAAAASPASSSKSGPTDEASDTSSPASSPEYTWGYGFNPVVGESGAEGVTGGLNADNTLKLDSRTITALGQSYTQNIHLLHPIIDEPVLNKMLEQFKRRYCSASDLATSKASFLPNANLDALRETPAGFNKPIKRKHSDGAYYFPGAEASLAQGSISPRPLFERSPTTAIVLLVMALGKICQCREPLPGPVYSNTKEAMYPRPFSPMGARMDSPHSPSSTYSTSAPSPAGMGRPNYLSPRSTVAEASFSSRNLDIIPGLAYYAQATDILGNMTGSHDITYAQCCLLAGLYAGQLANSIESLNWIQSAARACRILVRDPTLSNFPKARQDPIRMAFYTASQLESDICAEIDFPTSGIKDIEGVAYPAGYVAENDVQPTQDVMTKDKIMQFYSYQLHIRRILDQSQQGMYAPGLDVTETQKMRPLRNILDDWIVNWRDKLVDDLKWNDDDPPTRDINAARLRGKFYGAQYIIHRPFLHYALELDANGGLDQYMAEHDEQQAGAMRPPRAASDPYLDEVLGSAKVTIKAAYLSTQAFDGVMDLKRLIVTNIVGTAHAQFGNMLVLSAVYKSKHLKRYISTTNPRNTMEHLFNRTITFLRSLKPISPTLNHDMLTLQSLREVVFEGEAEDTPTVSSSFG